MGGSRGATWTTGAAWRGGEGSGEGVSEVGEYGGEGGFVRVVTGLSLGVGERALLWRWERRWSR